MPSNAEIDIDWDRLLALRDSFLEGSAGRRDYWREESVLRDYDETFGRRIAWKWRWVMADLAKRGWSLPPGTVLDWGCGTGVAAREFAAAFSPSGIAFHDRSPLAVRFAQSTLRRDFPHISIQPAGKTDVLLISHVLNELAEDALVPIFRMLRGATACIWVEPGTFDMSRRLLEIRQKLMADGFHIVAPCTHQAACGMAAAGRERDWCHHFAPPPPEVFTESFWSHFSRIMGVDLRSLPLSYLVVDRRPVPALPEAAVRILGRPRIYKPHAILQGCDEVGIRDRLLKKRRHPGIFRRMRHHALFSLQTWEVDDAEVLEFGPEASDQAHDAATDEVEGSL